MSKRKNNAQEDASAKELVIIKRLLILLLLKAGTSKSEIENVLELGRGNFGRIFPSAKFKSFDAEK